MSVEKAKTFSDYATKAEEHGFFFRVVGISVYIKLGEYIKMAIMRRNSLLPQPGCWTD